MQKLREPAATVRACRDTAGVHVEAKTVHEPWEHAKVVSVYTRTTIACRLHEYMQHHAGWVNVSAASVTQAS